MRHIPDEYNSAYFRRILEIIFPETCILCGSALLFNSSCRIPLCYSCCESIHPISGRTCAVCGMPLISERKSCLRCRSRSFFFDNNVSLFEYECEIRELINAYKFRSERRLAGFFACFFAEAYFRFYKDLPVVPVPLRRNAKKKRGWDQVEEILRHCRRSYGIKTLKLLRRKGNRQQKSLNYQERLDNLKSSIFLRNTMLHVPEKLVLFDDIFTTGATVSECARVLKKAGAEQVYVLTIAID